MDEKSIAAKLHTPVIIVGNITAGGTGKTPMVRFLMRYITAMGFKVGVISRGHGGSYKGVHHLQASDTASLVGDEMAMQYAYAQRQGLTNIEFVVCKERTLAALKAQELGVDFIIADDGLQHYRLPRHIEIAVIGKRGLGNELFIPAGPLREDSTRLKTVDYIINNSQDLALGGYKMEQFNLGFLPLSEISTPSSPAKLLHILANWQNWLLDSGYEEQYNDLLSAYLDEQALEEKYAKHLLAADDLTHLKDKDSHSANAWNVPKVTVHQSLDQTPLSPDLQQAAQASLDRIYEKANESIAGDSNSQETTTTSTVTATSITAQQERSHVAHAEADFPRYTFNPAASSADATKSASSVTTAPSSTKTSKNFLDVTTTMPNAGFGIFGKEADASHSDTHVNSVHSSATEEATAMSESKQQLDAIPSTPSAHSSPTSQSSNPTNPTAKTKPHVITAPLFDNSDEFMEFINHQIDPNVLSTEALIRRTKAFLAESNVLTEQMAATFPKVIALCAIGYPQDFKQTLEGLGFEVVEFFTFKDHHNFEQADIDNIYSKHPEYKDYPLLVTEKDAIKLKDLSMPDNCFFLEREGYFSRYLSWLDSLKERLIKVYTSGKDSKFD